MTQGSRPLSGHWLAALTRRFRESECGTTLVEFALGAVILLSLILGIVEFGRAAFTQAILYYAAEEATRYAIVNPQDNEGGETELQFQARIKDHAKKKLILISSSSNVANVNTNTPSNADATRFINVDIDYEFKFMVPWIGVGPLKFESSSTGFLADEES